MTKRDLVNSIISKVKTPVEKNELRVFANRQSLFTLEVLNTLLEQMNIVYEEEVLDTINKFTHNGTIPVQPSIIKLKNDCHYLYYGYKRYLKCENKDSIVSLSSIGEYCNVLWGSKSGLYNSITNAMSVNPYLGETVFLYYMLQATSYHDVRYLTNNPNSSKYLTAFMKNSGFNNLYYTGYTYRLAEYCNHVPNMIAYDNYNIKVSLDSENKIIYFCPICDKHLCYRIDFREHNLDKISDIELLTDIVLISMSLGIGNLDRSLIQDFVEDIILE